MSSLQDKKIHWLDNNRSAFANLVVIVLLAALYFTTARFGLSLAFEVEQVTAVWPPTGIALAAVILFGYRIWPGIALGAFLANITANEPFGTALGITIGNTLEAVVAVWVLRRFTNFHASLRRLKDVLRLIVIAAVFCTMISATIGVLSLCLGGVQEWERFGSIWLLWWLGDATGALIIAPLLLVWSHPLKWPISFRYLAEAACLIAGLLIANLFVFAEPAILDRSGRAFIYIIFPFIIWAALHFNQRGTTFVTLIASIIAVWATVHQSGPFSSNSILLSLILVQSFMAVVAATGLFLGAAIAERNMAELRQRMLLSVSHILATSNDSKQAILEILRSICQTLDWDFSAFWHIDKETQVLRCEALWHVPEIPFTEFSAITQGMTFIKGRGIPGHVWEHKAPFFIPDIREFQNFPRAPVAAREHIRSAFAFPVMLGDKVLGIMEFFCQKTRSTDPAILQMFEAIGSQIGQFIERKRAETDLRKSELLYRGIGESINYGIWVCDLEGRNIYASQSFLDLIGITQEECSTFGWTKLLPTDDIDETIALWKNCVKTQRLWNKEHRFLGKDGKWHSILARGVPVKNEQGDVICWAGINLDISELKIAEEALRESDRKKDEFLAILAHELRNPLAPLGNALHMLQQKKIDAGLLEEVKTIMERQLQQMVRLVDDLLDVSRISHGKIELRKAPVDLIAILQDAIETAQHLIVERNHGLDIKLPTTPLYVNGDTARLAQIFGNLLNNAAKYTEHGGLITLEAEPLGNEVIIRITDTGIGIPSDMLERIFTIFTQVDNSLERSHGGLGLGLTLVKNLVDLHGGSVVAESSGRGKGSQFIVRLPLIKQRVVSSTVSIPTSTGTPSKSLQVLVVDDNVASAKTMGWMLELDGHEVRLAHDAEAALQLARELHPNIVLLDIGLPGVSGYEICRLMKEEPGMEKTIFIAQTGWGQESYRKRALDAGFHHYLVKPVDVATLRKLLESL